ncbi:MAG: NAD(P)/FAD-dependent oxidoreductase [Chlamydiia bacterium]|nr:NAD(P)/FAD-dependent oxidoreductase [Chlamydiia bacterium]
MLCLTLPFRLGLHLLKKKARDLQSRWNVGFPRVVIIGGGFGGLQAAQGLRNAKVKLTLIDRTNHHLFQPLLYQVASAALAPRDVAIPIREVLCKQENASVMMDDVLSIDCKAQTLALRSGRQVEFDYLVVAAGARHSYFGHGEWEAVAPGLKTLHDAIQMRQKILSAYEAAEIADSREESERLLTFVVIGGGPTGVELSGAIAEIAQKAMIKNFRRIDPSHTKVYLVEAGPRVLAAFPEQLSEQARSDLTQLGVTVLTGHRVLSIDRESIAMDGGRVIKTRNVFWAAGNQASPLLSTLGVPLDPQGRAIVGPDLSLPGFPTVFVIGDAAHCAGVGDAPLPAVASVAMQQGAYVAHLIHKAQEASQRPPFRYRDKGAMATIGKARAVAAVGGRCFTGFSAWVVWSVIHIAYLIGFRNRVIVMLEWLFWYVSGKRSSRLIYDDVWRDENR